MNGFQRCATIRDLRNAARKVLDVMINRDPQAIGLWTTPGTPFYTAFSELEEAADRFDTEGAEDLHRIFAHYHPELAAATEPPREQEVKVLKGSYTPPKNQIPPPPPRELRT